MILGSDKTHLTNITGDKACHAVYMTCGNIKKDLRNKGNARAWRMVAHIPVVKFNEVDSQGVLSSRLYHACLDIVLQNLKKCGEVAQEIPDSTGLVRRVRTVLLSHIGDLPEQKLIACVSGSMAPSSTASQKQFGDGKAHPPRHGSKTMAKIDTLRERFGEENVGPQFQKACRAAGVNGVLYPYWRDWIFADPSTFLTPDSLHQWHKCFQDHTFKWGQKLLGAEEFDKRLSVLQKRVGFRHFKQGVRRFKQKTGRESRDLERTFLTIIAGHENVTPRKMKAFRAYLDFIYLGQYESHDEETLGYIEAATRAFWKNVHYLAHLRTGPRQGRKFDIPKLELMHQVPRLIKQLGSAAQFTSDTTEKLHIIMAKIPYQEGTNHKNFVWQMCAFVERYERFSQFQRFLIWCGLSVSDVVLGLAQEDTDLFLRECLQKRAVLVDTPPFEEERVVVFENGGKPQSLVKKLQPFDLTGAIVLEAENSAFTFTAKPLFSKRTFSEISELYLLPELLQKCVTYFTSTSGAQSLAEKDPGKMVERLFHLKTWGYFRMQGRSEQDATVLLPPQTVQAYPPQAGSVGHCDTVLVHQEAVSAFGGTPYTVRGDFFSQSSAPPQAHPFQATS